MRGTGRGRGRGGRGRGRDTSHVRRIVNRAEVFTQFTPPIRQPNVNRTFVFPMTVLASHAFTATANAAQNLLIKIEDLIGLVCETVDMTSSWYPLIKLQVHRLKAYGLIPTGDKHWTPTLTVVAFDPLTGVQGKSYARVGDVDDPARLGLEFPAAVKAHLFNWDGTAGTSKPVVGLRSADTLDALVYFDVVVTIEKSLTWTSSTDEVTPPEGMTDVVFVNN